MELLSTVEGYEDFVRAVMNVAPVPIGFEDIPGDSKGYFHTQEKRIAVQENMSESQTLKTMVHEVAHSMLHNREVNRDNVLDEPVKDRNTKEVEAESIAYTVCQQPLPVGMTDKVPETSRFLDALEKKYKEDHHLLANALSFSEYGKAGGAHV